MRRRSYAATTAREFIAKEVQRWLAEEQIKTIYIDPGRTASSKASTAACATLCLNQEQLWTLTEARVVIEDLRCEYNQHQPHDKLGYQSPARFATQLPPFTPASLVDAGQPITDKLQTNQPTD